MKYKKVISCVMAALMVFTGGYINTCAAENTAEISEYAQAEHLVWNYTTGENTNNAFAVTANAWSKKVEVKYGDQSFTKAIKMETTTKIEFDAPAAGTLEVVTYATKKGPYINVNGKKYSVSENGGTKIDITEKGKCTIEKETSNTYMYYLAFSYETGGETQTFIYGDVTADGMLAADDASAIMQKVLLGSYTMPIEEKTSDWFKYTDVSADDLLAADDALCVMQAVLVDSYKMPVLNKTDDK